ncbi:MAG: hypothetical protein LAT67_02210 [Balneolales bacterium]|nr:hypothetical protein [Balneolales bacterium]
MQKLQTVILNLLLIATLTVGCSNSSGSSAEEPPEPPEFQTITIDLGIFEMAGMASGKMDNFIKKTKSMRSALTEARASLSDVSTANNQDSFETAGYYAVYADMLFQTLGLYPAIFFNMNNWDDAQQDGNIWYWEFNQSFEGETIGFRITAEVTSDRQLWEMRWSYSGPDMPDVNNALFMSANITLQGDSGSWTMYDIFEDMNQPFADFEFVTENDITRFVDLMLLEGSDTYQIVYEAPSEIASLVFGGYYSSEDVVKLEWHRTEGWGWIESPQYNDGNRSCWDTNFLTVPCNPAL